MLVARRVPAMAAVTVLIALIPPPSASADAPHIESTSPAKPARTVQLEEIWRVGGEDGGILFGLVTEAATDPEGNVYLLDTQLLHVQAISPEGEHMGTLSREGDGPGEVRRPRDVVWLPDETIGLLELFPAEIVRVTPDGEPRGTLTVGGHEEPQTGFTSASSCIHRGGTFLLAGQRLTQSDTGQARVMYLCRLSEAGEERVRYRETTMTLDFNKLHWVERKLSPSFFTAAVGPDGRVYTPQAWDRYAIEVFHPDGTLDRVIERDFENRKRTEQELRRVHALYDASDRNSPYKSTRDVEPSPQVITDLHVDADGNLWVLHSRSAEDQRSGIMQTYDVFDANGVYVQETSVACEGNPEFDGLEFLPDGRVLLIKGYVLAGMARSDLGSVPLGEDEESSQIEIICCRMVAP